MILIPVKLYMNLLSLKEQNLSRFHKNIGTKFPYYLINNKWRLNRSVCRNKILRYENLHKTHKMCKYVGLHTIQTTNTYFCVFKSKS